METSPIAKEIQKVSLEHELKQSYLAYAMSVIVGRALPDVRDGLKPVHRRVLFAMHELGNDWNKPYKKSARVVGDVIGKYHPHGDTAVYDTIVRMAQPFSMRYLLVDGQGNFGSVDGDAAAAMRYTEVRMSRFAHALLADLEKETVDFSPNYDESEMAPDVMPTQVPHLLVNGSSGIAVGMATNIPPHNLTEVIGACIAMIDNPAITVDEILQYIPGPDFPTAGIIHGRGGIHEAYKTGRGRVYVRAKIKIESDEKSNKDKIIINELPYQVNKARLVERIAELVKEKKIEGIVGLRDESDKDGMRVVVELKRGENTDVVINNLYVHTQMQSVFGINMVALVEGQPRLLNIQQIIEAFLRHRQEVITRRTIFDLRKARERAHILEGMAIALSNIDEMITLIKQAKDPAEAKMQLMGRVWHPAELITMLTRIDGGEVATYGLADDGYHLSPEQAQSILDMRLHRLTGLEQDKIIGEHKQLQLIIHDLSDILANSTRLMQVIREELLAIKEQFGDERRTEIIESEGDFSLEDLLPEENVVVTLSHEGYAKIQPITAYQAQHRGGKGKSATDIKEEDFIERLLVASTHDTILCFSNNGKVYWLKVYQLPQAGRNARGKPIVNLLPLAPGERINAILPIREYTKDLHVFMATSMGTVKKVELTDFSRPRSNGIIAIELRDDDRLIGADITNGTQEVMLFTDAGKVIRFAEAEVRCMGRTACGVRGVKLQDGQRVKSLVVVGEGDILTATEHGYGKRTPLDEYRATGRGGQGVISIQVTERNGKVVGAIQVNHEDEVMLVTNKGTLVRVPAAEISLVGRNTQGVRLISLTNDELLVGLERVATLKGEEVNEADSPSNND
jgi:DNA gyrase subunit A